MTFTAPLCPLITGIGDLQDMLLALTASVGVLANISCVARSCRLGHLLYLASKLALHSRLALFISSVVLTIKLCVLLT